MKVSWTTVSAHHTTRSPNSVKKKPGLHGHSAGSIVPKKKKNGDLLVNKPVPVECYRRSVWPKRLLSGQAWSVADCFVLILCFCHLLCGVLLRWKALSVHLLNLGCPFQRAMVKCVLLMFFFFSSLLSPPLSSPLGSPHFLPLCSLSNLPVFPASLPLYSPLAA